MTLYEKSLNTLELPTVLDMLAAEAASAPAKEQALALSPSDDIYEVRRRLEETTAARDMLVLKGAPGFSTIKDIRGSLARADMGGALSMRELLDIASILRTAREIKAYGSGERGEKSGLDYLFSSLQANRPLEERITSSILGDDEMADSASSELASIRRHMRVAGDKVRQSLQKIISSPYYQKFLQDPIITIRNERYVVPVKAENRAAIPGLVHDISSSGATLFVEPMTAVEANNEIRELLSREKNEIDRILHELSGEASACSADITCDFSTLVQLDLIFAKAKFSCALNCSDPEVSESGELVLKKARHPLLPKGTAVPIDIRLGGDFDTLVITGPNTGGKTVSLKTLGLLCAMAMCGLHIPTGDGSVVPVYKEILADIGDEQSIEQSLSTFSAHMTNIVGILEQCGGDSLLLFDELGAGTDPVEGAALATSIIEYARARGSRIAATTHYAELKIYAMTTPGVCNASCEFDVQTLRPTYRVLIGVPGKSNAFAISERLGLPGEIIEDAKNRVDSDSRDFEDVLQSLELTRQKMEQERAQTDALLLKAQDDAKKAEEYRDRLEKEREKAAQIARREADEIIEQARRTSDEIFKEMNEARKKASSDGGWQVYNDLKSSVRKKLNDAEDALRPVDDGAVDAAPPTRDPVAGDTVEILSVGTKAQVISVNPDGTVYLQAGIMKVTTKAADVRVIEDAAAKPQTPKGQSSFGGMHASVAPELDIRGMTADEAIPVMERYIDSAQLAKLNTVTIIHGKGTGALRTAVQQSLKKNRQVKSFRLGRYGEGEMGVTVVTLR